MLRADLCTLRLCQATTPAVHAGCTAVVVAVHGSLVVCANAGDSRAVLCRGGTAVPLSEDHKPRNPLENRRITAAGGWVNKEGRVNDNLNLSRAIGDLEYKQDFAIPPSAQIISGEPGAIC